MMVIQKKLLFHDFILKKWILNPTILHVYHGIICRKKKVGVLIMNLAIWSPNLQQAVRTIAKLNPEEVLVKLRDDSFLKSLSISREEVSAITQNVKDSGNTPAKLSAQEWWA